MKSLRITALVIVLLLAITQIPAVKQVTQRFKDKFDKRPEVTVLFIGNSRTYYHDMPFMVREIADSANSPNKYSITMHAPGGVRFEDHWNNQEVKNLLSKKWNYVVFQGRSNEQQNEATNQSFHNYGSSLINMAKYAGSTPVLFMSWRYADDYEFYREFPHLKATLLGSMYTNYAKLSTQTGARVVKVGAAWERLLSYHPPFQLYEDGNHPTIHGSYLTALMFYKFFSGDDLANVTYVPSGVSAEDAELIKKVANLNY